MPRSLFLLALVAWSLLALGDSVAAQEAGTPAPPRRPVTDEEWRVAGDRNREFMRVGEEPLALVGIEQGDNDFRSRTPALLNTAGETLLIDVDEAYRRKLDMYARGETFTAPPPTVEATRSRTPDRRWTTRPLTAKEIAALTPPEPEPGAWRWVVPLAGFGVLFLLVLKRSGFFVIEGA